jgi:MFS family permease
LRSNFSVLLYSTVVGDIVSPIFALFLPLFAYNLGASVFELGLVGGVSYASYSFMPFVVGRYSDQVQRRMDFTVISLGTLAACSFVYVFVGSPVQLIALRVLEGIGWAILWPIIDAEVSEDASRESSKALSIYNTVWAAAGAVGPLVGVALIILLSQIRYIFIVTSLMMVSAIVVNAVFMRKGRRASIPSAVSEIRTEKIPVATKQVSPNSIWVFVIAMIVQSAIRGVLFTFYPPLAASMGVSFILVGVIGVVGVVGFVFGVGRSSVFAFTTRDDFRGFFLRRDNVRPTLIISMAISAVAGSLPFLGGGTLVVGLVSFAIVAISSSFTVMISQVEMITRAEANRKGSGAGIFESTIGIGIAIGPILAGIVSGGSLSTPFLIPPASFLVSLPLLFLFFRRRNVSMASS